MSKYDMAEAMPLQDAMTAIDDASYEVYLSEKKAWREQCARQAAVVEAAIAWANAEYDDDYVEEQTLLSRVNYLRKLEGESDG